MNKVEIDECLQYYATLLNKNGGTIYVNEGELTKFEIGRGKQYTRASVENCGIVIEYGGTFGSYRTVTKQYIPYHSIVRVVSSITTEV